MSTVHEQQVERLLRIQNDKLDRIIRLLEEKAETPEPQRYYEIIGGYTGIVIGWTVGEGGKADVLAEEPKATFREITKEQYMNRGQ